MSISEKIYDKSPIFIQHIMVSIKGIQNKKNRYGSEYYRFRNFLKDFDKWSLKEKKRYQINKLQKLLNYAISKSGFYGELYSNIDISSIKSIEDLKKLPIVDKEMIRKNIHSISTVDPKQAIKSQTGGTTGKSLNVLSTKRDHMRAMALIDHYKERVGFIHRKMKRATFNGKHIVPPNQKKNVYWRYNISCKQMIFSSFHITEKSIKYYIEKLNEFKPEALDGFLSSICEVASYVERHNIQLKFHPIAIFPMSEALTEIDRELLERVFGCKVYNQYGSSEGAPVINECKEQKLHVELASGIFEEKDDGEVIVTGFTTYGTPLIRYEIGDSITFYEKSEKCSCGMESPLVKQINGRGSDYLYTIEGAKIKGGNIANMFKNIPNAIIRAQVIQEKLNEVTILLEIDKSKYKPEYDKIIESEFNHRFGYNTILTIKHVEDIPREKSGKFRMIKNKLQNTL